jgi:hypothetical protein
MVHIFSSVVSSELPRKLAFSSVCFPSNIPHTQVPTPIAPANPTPLFDRARAGPTHTCNWSAFEVLYCPNHAVKELHMSQLRAHGALVLEKSGMEKNETDPGLEPVALWLYFGGRNVVAVKPLAQVVNRALP